MAVNVETKIGIWKNKLLDLGKRNRLLNYKFTKSGDLTLIIPQLNILYQKLVIEEKMLNFPHVEIRVQDVDDMFEETDDTSLEEKSEELVEIDVPGDISTDRTAKETQRIAKKLKDKAKTAKEEQGINVLFASFGFLEWRESENSNILMNSPLVLVPVNIMSEGINDPYTLSLHEDEIVINPTLLFKLENDFGIVLPEFDAQCDDILDYFSIVNERVVNYGWKVIPKVNISLLSFQKINMYKDMDNRFDIIASNPIVRALAGESNAFATEVGNFDAMYDHDKDSVMQIFQVVDADSSQQDAITMSKKGVSFILQGPPGTGKSQTITNIIAEALADGKKVLFVSEKMAALEVVYKRLESVGLADFCLVLHSNKTNKKEFMESLRNVLNIQPISVKESAIYRLSTLEDRRKKLNDYSQELHKIIEPLGQSVFEANGQLATLEKAPNIAFSLKRVKVEEITKEQLYDLRIKINDLAKAKQKLKCDYKDNTWKYTTIDKLNHELRHDLYAILDTLDNVIGEYLIKSKKFEGEIYFDSDVRIQEYDKTIDFLHYSETSPTFPENWIDYDGNSIVSIKNKAIKCSDRNNKKIVIKKSLDGVVVKEAFELDAIATKEYLIKIITEIQSYLISDFFDVEKLLNELDELEKTINNFKTVLKREKEISEFVADEMKVFIPQTCAELMAFSEILKVYNEDIRPNEFWFTDEWRRKTERNECFDNAKRLIMQVSTIKDKISEKYDLEILDIDYKDILSRMRTDYTSFWGRITRRFRQDINSIRTYCKVPTKKLPINEALEILESIKAYYDALNEYEINRNRFEQYLGGWLIGESTDFNKIESSILNFEKLLGYYGNSIPDEIKSILLMGMNVDKYGLEVKELSNLVSDDSIVKMFNIFNKIDRDTDLDILLGCVEKLSTLFTSCKAVLNKTKGNDDCKESWYSCFCNLDNLYNLQLLIQEEKEERTMLESIFGEMYKFDNTDWCDIIRRLDWVSVLIDKANDIDIRLEYKKASCII